MDLFDVSGKTVLVTGGSRGVGEMIATGFVHGGARVYVSSRKAEACEEVATRLTDEGPGTCLALPADLSTRQACDELAVALGEREQRLEVLVNNAGAAWGAPLEEYPESGWDKVLDLNVKSVFHLTRACLDLLRAAASDDDPARVINIGSIEGFSVPAWENYAYTASKAAVHQLTRHLGSRLAREHITVNAIAPGLFESRMTAFAFEGLEANAADVFPLQRTGRPDDLAGAAIFLASRAGAYVTGAVLPVDGGVATLR